MLADFLKRCALAETGDVGVVIARRPLAPLDSGLRRNDGVGLAAIVMVMTGVAAPGVVGAGYAGDVFL